MKAEDKIRKFVIDDLRWEGKPGDLKEDTSLIDGAMDSLGIVKTISFLERDFGIKVDEDEILPENFETIGALADFARRKSG